MGRWKRRGLNPVLTTQPAEEGQGGARVGQAGAEQLNACLQELG